jgi:hypothetical protein
MNEKDNHAGNQALNNKYVNNNSKRVNILTPAVENNTNANDLSADTKKLKRKPKFKKSVVIDESDQADYVSHKPGGGLTPAATSKNISPVETNQLEENFNQISITPNTQNQSRNLNNKSKSPGIPKDLNNKESRRGSLNDFKENNNRPSPNNMNGSINERNNNNAPATTNVTTTNNNNNNKKPSQPNTTNKPLKDERKLRRQVNYYCYCNNLF